MCKTHTWLITFPVTVSNTHAFVFWQTESKKNCAASSVASCFHRCPEGFWIELLWVLCAAESGHWVHLTSDLPTASGGEAFLLRKGRPSCRSHMFLSNSHSKGCFSHHGPNTLLCSFLAKIQGSGRSHEWGPAQYSWRTWPSANATVRPFSTGQGKYGKGLNLGERSGLSYLA